MKTIVVLVPTRNQSWNVGSVARLVTSKGIAVVKRTTQMLVVRERGLRTNPKTKIESGSTTHVCKYHCCFKTYEPVEDGSILYMGDEHLAPVHGKGSIALEFSSGKTITLFNVYESDEYILSKSGVFVGFGYYNNGMFMLNLNKVPGDSDYVYMSSSTVINSSLWHARLEHRHYKRMLEMSKDDLIPGIIYETIAPYTPHQNGVVERKNRALKKMVNFMAVVRLPCPKRKTLGEKGINCIFVGYANNSKAYRFYVIEPNDFISINSVIKSRDAISDENCFSSIPRPNDIIPNVEESQMDDHTNDVPSEILETRKGKRVQKAKSYGFDFQLYLVEGSRDQVGSQYYNYYSIDKDPRTCDEAMQSRDAAFWKEAIDEEIGSIMENNTLVLYDLHLGCKPLDFRQKEGIYYFDTYAPVARITTIRLLLALAVIHNLVIHQMYVKTTFLNGDLDEKVYMKQPEGFVMPGNEHKVCKLVKSLYGLKQAPSKFDSSSKGVIICLYVNDMLIFGTDQNQVDKTKKFLSSRFFMKDMADVILRIKIKRKNKGIVITQSHYIKKILKKSNREDCSPVSTPMDLVDKLKPNTGKPIDQLEYSRAIGGVMYAMTSTRPDITYAVGRLSRFTSNPSRQHWKAITRVFKYLRSTMNYGLSYMGYPSVLEGYSDASWINHVEDSSSTSGWVFLLGGGAISWASKKQTCITSSTMESEFVALAAAGKEAEWLRNLIHEIPIWPKPIAPISIRCDSAPTMARAYSQIYNGKSRHLGVRHSMVRELIRNGVISIEFVRTQHNLADHLTKGLARDLLEIGTQVSSSRGARSKGTTYVNMKFSRFKKLGLSFLYVHQWIGTHGL
ncbi:zinc finger, CCHC-type containing protein [Tanacetum coccineum]